MGERSLMDGIVTGVAIITILYHSPNDLHMLLMTIWRTSSLSIQRFPQVSFKWKNCPQTISNIDVRFANNDNPTKKQRKRKCCMISYIMQNMGSYVWIIHGRGINLMHAIMMFLWALALETKPNPFICPSKPQ